MGSTPRTRLTQLPLPTRSSEASAECFGRVVLSYLREDEQAPASFFILGDALHQGIERAILEDVDNPDDSIEWVKYFIAHELDNVDDLRDTITTSKRDLDTIYDDAERMMDNWYNYVHPDSAKRHPIYDDYSWPPTVEQEFHRTAASAGTKYAVWGSVDALFEHKRIGEVHHPWLIIDWKSGTQRQKSDFQLNYYRFGMALTEEPAAFHHLDRVQNRSIIQEAAPYPGDQEILDAIALTERRKDAVLAGRMPRFVPDWYCGYCPVQHLCPADGDPRDRPDNMAELQELLQSVEPMKEIESSIEGGRPIGRV